MVQWVKEQRSKGQMLRWRLGVPSGAWVGVATLAAFLAVIVALIGAAAVGAGLV
jgi:hypothetical protein